MLCPCQRMISRRSGICNAAYAHRMTTHSLDARNTLCPMPVIKTQNRVAELAVGDILEVISTDPGALNDIPAWCRINGHSVLHTEINDNEVLIRIQIR